MKTAFVTMILFLGLTAHAETCKVGDLKDCAKALKAKQGAEDFNSTYDKVCSENKTFKCLKRTVRGDLKEELGYMKDEFPKAHLFPTKENGEDKVFVLDKK
ncbi:hypothetical protein [Bdellovibrio sp. HCB337]|uniref:hypothetical protein n=1 Tax=Bdellovibrio sp. HCB337 TaxID=3394358 RepID=UPI0039A72585